MYKICIESKRKDKVESDTGRARKWECVQREAEGDGESGQVSRQKGCTGEV